MIPAEMDSHIDISEEAGVRYLHFGSSWVQGAMRIARPFALELDYTREMMTPLLLLQKFLDAPMYISQNMPNSTVLRCISFPFYPATLYM